MFKGSKDDDDEDDGCIDNYSISDSDVDQKLWVLLFDITLGYFNEK
jgi:hypothetical protein